MQPDEQNDADLAFRRYLERPRRRRLARLVDAYYGFVWDTALRVTGNAADAADITQDVFLKLLLHPSRPDQVRSARGFLAWEVVGRATNLRRAAGRRREREQAAASRAGEDGLSAADLDELRARVRELPGDLRAAVELRYFAGVRNRDIAAVTGVGERHVEKRQGEGLIWELSGLPAGTFTVNVDARSVFVAAPAEVTAGQGDGGVAVIRFERRVE